LELTERPTKDELLSIKKQLKMLQRIAFNVHDDDEGEVITYLQYYNYLMQIKFVLFVRVEL
jgi:hypothetical protein